MLYLVFHVGGDRFLIEAAQVHEVAPLIGLRKVPNAPDYVAGLMDYRGSITPVIDLSQLFFKTASRSRLSTRIILTRYQSAGRDHVLGLIGERVMDTTVLQKADFEPSGVHAPQAEYLGRLARLEGELVQVVKTEQLLPDSVQELLFRQDEEEHVAPGD